MTSRRRVSAWLVCVAATAAALSCGGSPAAPSVTVIDISGSWTGTWTFSTAGATVTDTMSATFSQSDTRVQGQWSASTGPGGQLVLTEGAGLVGTVTISQVLLNGASCIASTTVTGTATSSRVQLTLGPLSSSGLCQWGTNQTFDLSR